MVEPVYPQDARAANVQGVVSLEAVIARDGTVKQVKVLSGSPLLTESSVRAVKQWRYDPTVINGKSVEVIVPIDVAYKLKLAEPAPAPAQPAAPVASHLPGEVLAPMSGPCTLGKADFKNQGSKLVVTMPYTYQGTEKLGTIALLAFPLDASQHQIQGLKYGEWTLKDASGTASVSVESRPTLGHQGARSEYLDMVVVIKGTSNVVCSQILYYPRQW
jgi:TonB family protein